MTQPELTDYAALLLRDAGLDEVVTWPDLAGIPRVSGGKR